MVSAMLIMYVRCVSGQTQEPQPQLMIGPLAGTSEVMNSRDDPERISLRSQTAILTGTQFEFTFPPLTLTLLELELRP